MKTKAAIEFFGSISQLARVLRISRWAIYQWGDEVPRARQYELQVLTSGALTASPQSDLEPIAQTE